MSFFAIALLIALTVTALYSAVLVWHWYRYCENAAIATLSLVLFFGVTILLFIIMTAALAF